MKNLMKNRQGRTLEGTVFEVAFLVLAALVWGLIAWLYVRAPESVPTHFNALGNPDAWGHPSNMLAVCGLMTILGFLMLLGAYFPSTISMPFEIRTPRQITLGQRLLRITALLFLLLTIAIAFGAMKPPYTLWPLFVLTGVIILVVLVFAVLMWKAR